MIKHTTRKTPVGNGRTPVTAGTGITSGVRNRKAAPVMASFAGLNDQQKAFARQLQANVRRHSAIMGATNTSNIMAKPEFMELLPMFVQKLLILDVFGSVAMKSRQQLIPYFKFIAENTKGETKAGTILNSPFANRQGLDPNFSGRVVKNEEVDLATGQLAYSPILPGSLTVTVNDGATETLLKEDALTVDYANGIITGGLEGAVSVKATYQYDNETVGPDANGQYGAKMAKGYLALDEFNLVAEAHELACYWSIYSAFAAQTEYGANIGDIAKEAAFSEITAEINSKGFQTLKAAAQNKPQFNWDASPVLAGSVVPTDYLNMFKLKLGQAAASIYQATRLARPNRLVVGSNVAEYIGMMNGFSGENVEDTVGPYKFGKLDNFEIYVEPSYDPNEWVMSCKSNDIRRNSALFGEYMPLTSTDAIGLANTSVQQGYATMYAMKVVNPDTVVRGKIVGTF